MIYDGKEYQIGIDTSNSESVAVEERFIRPSAEYPDGSYIQIVDGTVTIATGKYATIYPHRPSYHWHGGAPWIWIDTSEWATLPWSKPNTKTKQDDNIVSEE